MVSLWVGGCTSTAYNIDAARAFYAYDFLDARAQYRPDSIRRPFDENSVLNNARLGMAALADGDPVESTSALSTAYKLLESGSVNDDARILAATVISDGVTVYKGEPFEQAFTYTALAYANALKGDWENVRVCARATVRKLYDFQQADPNSRSKLEQEGVRLVETDFTLGYLLQAIADRIIGEDSPALQQALSLDQRLYPLADRLKPGRFNVVVVVEAGRGPSKQAYGEDNTLTRWVAHDAGVYGDLRILVNGAPAGPDAAPVVDVNQMAQDHRWNNLEESRRIKSALGTALMAGGGGVAVLGRSRDTQLAGVGALLLGLLVKASSGADTRYNELLPEQVFVGLAEVPPQGGTVEVGLTGNWASRVVVPVRRPGSLSSPSMIYLRLFRSGGTPAYLAAPGAQYANDAEPPVIGDYPWILGGHCVATPSQSVLATYQRGGFLVGLSLDELRELYTLEEIQIGVGPGTPNPADPSGTSPASGSYRHILEGGHALFTPAPGTVGYKRIMCGAHPTYVPKSERVRELARQIQERGSPVATGNAAWNAELQRRSPTPPPH